MDIDVISKLVAILVPLITAGTYVCKYHFKHCKYYTFYYVDSIMFLMNSDKQKHFKTKVCIAYILLSALTVWILDLISSISGMWFIAWLCVFVLTITAILSVIYLHKRKLKLLHIKYKQYSC